MNINKTIGKLCAACAIMGIVFFAYQKELVIIRSWSSIQAQYPAAASHAVEKKAVKLFFYKDHQWHFEIQHVLWTRDCAQNIHSILNALCTLLDEEGITQEKVHVQSVALSQCMHHVYISFDRSPLSPQHSIEHKAMLVAAISKTLAEHAMPIHDMFVLAKHKLIEDTHLDMSRAWPIA